MASYLYQWNPIPWKTSALILSLSMESYPCKDISSHLIFINGILSLQRHQLSSYLYQWNPIPWKTSALILSLSMESYPLKDISSHLIFINGILSLQRHQLSSYLYQWNPIPWKHQLSSYLYQWNPIPAKTSALILSLSMESYPCKDISSHLVFINGILSLERYQLSSYLYRWNPIPEKTIFTLKQPTVSPWFECCSARHSPFLFSAAYAGSCWSIRAGAGRHVHTAAIDPWVWPAGPAPSVCTRGCVCGHYQAQYSPWNNHVRGQFKKIIK